MTLRSSFLLGLLLFVHTASIFPAALIITGANAFLVVGVGLIVIGLLWLFTQGLINDEPVRADYSDLVNRLNTATVKARGW